MSWGEGGVLSDYHERGWSAFRIYKGEKGWSIYASSGWGYSGLWRKLQRDSISDFYKKYLKSHVGDDWKKYIVKRKDTGEPIIYERDPSTELPEHVLAVVAKLAVLNDI